MNAKPEWDPKAADVLRDQVAAYDAMRERLPVAYSELLHWSVFRHEDVLRILLDHETFSSAVSNHLSVPSGMDPPEHTPYRAIVERYFTAERMAAFEPICRTLVVELLEAVLSADQTDLIADFSLPFAARVQCAFCGWPSKYEHLLVRWTQKNHAATFAQDRKAMSEIALEFEALIDDLLDGPAESAAGGESNVTTSLRDESVWGRPLSHEEIASILRNWTVGEIGTLSASVGIVAQYLAEHVELQSQLRAEPALVPAAIDEMLRIHGPLVANRRITKRPVEIGGRHIAAGQRLSLMWISANRDGRVFEEPNRFRLDRDPAQNLLYGAGLHVCPGAPLARLELRVCLEELLSRCAQIELIPENPPDRAVYPASGFSRLPLRVR